MQGRHFLAALSTIVLALGCGDPATAPRGAAAPRLVPADAVTPCTEPAPGVDLTLLASESAVERIGGVTRVTLVAASDFPYNTHETAEWFALLPLDGACPLEVRAAEVSRGEGGLRLEAAIVLPDEAVRMIAGITWGADPLASDCSGGECLDLANVPFGAVSNAVTLVAD